jgi:hypothetical protein
LSGVVVHFYDAIEVLKDYFRHVPFLISTTKTAQHLGTYPTQIAGKRWRGVCPPTAA